VADRGSDQVHEMDHDYEWETVVAVVHAPDVDDFSPRRDDLPDLKPLFGLAVVYDVVIGCLICSL